MKEFRTQFKECMVAGLVSKRAVKPGEFSVAQRTPLLKRGVGPITITEVNACGKFGGDCHNQNKDCQKLRDSDEEC